MPQMTWENFEDLLYARRDNVREWWDWHIPVCIFEYALESLRESDGLSDPELNCPSYIVDNIAVNGSWSEFDEITPEHYPEYAGLKGDELADAIEERGDAIAVFRDAEIVLWNLGL